MNVDLIVTHTNADFDAFGSIVAAKKLYPDSRLLLPGSQQRAVREFLSLVKDKIRIENEKNCDLRDIKRLIVVDTRQKSRIGIASGLLKGGSTEIHIYDHHPRAPHDIKGDKDIFQEVGATVSIIIDILRKRAPVKLTPLEATIMLLAVYEETGSLTYRTTTKLDVDTVSFLLSRGANLEAVSSYLNRKLTEEELAYLTALISSTKVIPVNGINIAVAEGAVKGFIGELGAIVRKLQNVENFPVLFVLFKMGDKIRIMARSRLKEVDVNRILKPFGGGGHRSAASAKVAGMDQETLKKKLMGILHSCIRAKIFVKDIMRSPVRVISADKTIKEAKKMLEKLRLKGAPVMEKNKIVGVITARDIAKALKYRYGHASVKGYMARNVITTGPNAPLHAIQKLMFEKNIGRLPVVKNKKLVGIITRTDVLKSVHREIFAPGRPIGRRRSRFDLSAKMGKILPGQILAVLRAIGRLANRHGYRAFVVGGFVRDILLNVRNLDIDIVVEGDAIAFGRRLARLYKGSLVAYEKFGTATVVTDKFKIDLATARKESYAKPAALPTVEFSSIKDDLERRDFTINAMAASVNKGSFGRLIDFFGGEKDLENGVIRVLHDASFIDDPTRIFRAVRFEQRLGFRLDAYTENLIKHAVHEGMFSRTQNQRIRDELMRIFREEEPMRAISRMKELHELRFIHRKITLPKEMGVVFRRIKALFGRYAAGGISEKEADLRVVYLMAFFHNLNSEEMRSVCERFVFRRSERVKLVSGKKNWKKTLKALSGRRLRPSAIFRALKPLSLEEILFIGAMAKKKSARSGIERFLREYRKTKIRISGNDLKKLGIKPGPVYSKLLTKVLYKKLDGEIKTKKEELGFVKRLLKP
jgi:tRNA nucleotidyltransferase (CCA-adding enzyme)